MSQPLLTVVYHKSSEKATPFSAITLLICRGVMIYNNYVIDDIQPQAADDIPKLRFG